MSKKQSKKSRKKKGGGKYRDLRKPALKEGYQCPNYTFDMKERERPNYNQPGTA